MFAYNIDELLLPLYEAVHFSRCLCHWQKHFWNLLSRMPCSIFVTVHWLSGMLLNLFTFMAYLVFTQAKATGNIVVVDQILNYITELEMHKHLTPLCLMFMKYTLFIYGALVCEW